MDEVDLKLITELRKNGRESFTSLAKRLGVTEGTVRNRVGHLLKSNLIEITAVSSPARLGYHIISVIGLQVNMANLRRVADALARKPNVCYLAFVTGRYDLIGMVITRTPQELSNFIEKEVSVVPGVLRSETFLNLDIIKGQWPAALDIVPLLQSGHLSESGKPPSSTKS